MSNQTSGTVKGTGARHGPLREVLAKLEDVTQEAGERMSKLLEDAEIKRRLSEGVDALDDVRLELTRRISGKPATTPFEEMTVKELQELARERGIEHRSSMNKAELIDALRRPD